MSNTRFGSTSWDEVEISNNGERKSTRDQYLKLENGSNVVRVITKPHEYLVHRVKVDPKAPGFGDRVMSCLFHGAGDPLTEPPYNLKPKRRWLVGVIDRKTQSYKILDMSVKVFEGIQALVRDEDWGSPDQYDIDIKVNKSAGPASYYQVTPKSKKPLSTSDIEIKQNVDLEELKKKCTPPTRQEVEARLEFLKKRAQNATAGNVAAAVQNSSAASSGSEDDMDFPTVN